MVLSRKDIQPHYLPSLDSHNSHTDVLYSIPFSLTSRSWYFTVPTVWIDCFSLSLSWRFILIFFSLQLSNFPLRETFPDQLYLNWSLLITLYFITPMFPS